VERTSTASPRQIVKTVLYAYRVLLTGIHLLRTGEVEANLARLAMEYQRPFLNELIARKREEKGAAPDLDWSFHDGQLRELEGRLESAHQDSALPEERDRQGLSELLVRWRCGEHG
jgi:predicted nucleotidyltransferase